MSANLNESEVKQMIAGLMRGDAELPEVLRMMDRLIGSMPRAPAAPRRPPAPAGMRYLTAAEVAERKADREAAKVEDADAELRLEVVEAMTATGIAPHVAANRTNTTAKLLAEARAFGIV